MDTQIKENNFGSQGPGPPTFPLNFSGLSFANTIFTGMIKREIFQEIKKDLDQIWDEPSGRLNQTIIRIVNQELQKLRQELVEELGEKIRDELRLELSKGIYGFGDGWETILQPCIEEN